MKKLLRYLVSTILFVVLWCLMFLPVMKYSIDMGATSAAAIGGIVAIIISYRLVTRINKSNLWSSLFDETEVDNKVVEEKIEKKVEVEDSNIFNPKNISIGILAIVLISVLYNQNTNLNKETKQELNTNKDLKVKFEEAKNKINLINSGKLYSAGAYTARAEMLYNGFTWPTEIKNLYIDAAIEEIEKAIILEPSNCYLYLIKAEYLERRASVLRAPSIDLFLEKSLVNLEIAFSLFPKGTAYAERHKYANNDSNEGLAIIYVTRSIIKEQLGLEYCSDLKKACKLERNISSTCGGKDQEDENCF